MLPYSKFFILVAGFLLFFILIPSVNAVSLTPDQQNELALIQIKLESLKAALEAQKSVLFSTVQASSCPTGYHFMAYYTSTYPHGYCRSDSNFTICQPDGGGGTFTCPDFSMTTTEPHFPSPDAAAAYPMFTATELSYAATTTPVIKPESEFLVDPSLTFPRNGETNVAANTRIRVKFTKEFDPASAQGQFFLLTPSAVLNIRIDGSFVMFPDGFEFTPLTALRPNTVYIYKIFTTLKDKNGNTLGAPYQAAFITAPAAQVTEEVGFIEGVVSDDTGKSVGGAEIRIFKEDFTQNFKVKSSLEGKFHISLPKGKYNLEVLPPFEKKDLVRPEIIKLSVESGKTETPTLKFATLAKTISGTVKFSDDIPITDAEVGAYSSENNQWISVLTDSSGRYKLKVGGGKWMLGIRPRDPQKATWSRQGPFLEVSFIKDDSLETKLQDFVIPVADVKLSVRTVDEKDSPLVGVGVIIDSVGASVLEGSRPSAPEFRKSDSTGSAIFTLQAGKYFIRAYLPPEKGLINPEEVALSFSAGETREVKMVFRKIALTRTATLKGVTKLEDGRATDAFIWAWSEKGRFAETNSNERGEFTLSLAADDRWHLGAANLIGKTPYKANEIVVEVGVEPLSVEIFLIKFKEDLPSPVSVSQAATEHVIVQAEDGAKVSIPPEAAFPSGTVNVLVKPTVEAPNQGGATVVSTVYEVNVRDQAGKEIEEFKEEIEVTLPYDEAELKARGLTEDQILPSFFDEETGTWVKIDNYTIDKDKNVIIARVKHLTRFAIVAAADITPPAAPSEVAASALGEGKIKISWLNPAKDFAHAKVYRSEKRGELGKIVAPEVTAATFIDNDVVGGITYYYTVRAVDLAGNESANLNQVSATAIGISIKEKPAPPAAVKLEILRTLTQGSSGDDVKALQELLVKEGVYPQGLITGFFGDLTRQAVIRFQEKYGSEILIPVGLAKGTGIVGPATRKKINELLGTPSDEKPALPPGQAIKFEILRNLTVGSMGDDVKALQELLLKEGVYPEGLITGFFGDLTRQAVIRFQEKYASEILTPIGETKGTGFVGSFTRNKLNQFLSR